MEKIGEFDFEIMYVPGVENVLADALSQMYSNEALWIVCAWTEYTYHDVIDNDMLLTHEMSMPVLLGIEAAAVSLQDDGSPYAATVETITDMDDGVNSGSILETPHKWKEARKENNQINNTKKNRKSEFQFKSLKTKSNSPSEFQHRNLRKSSGFNFLYRNQKNPEQLSLKKVLKRLQT